MLKSENTSVVQMAQPESSLNKSSTVMTEVNNAVTARIEQDDAPPDGGYGWVCVAACFTLNACTWGTTSVST